MTDHTPAAQPGQDDITTRLRENADLDAAETGVQPHPDHKDGGAVYG